MRRIKRHAQVRSLLPVSSEATKKMDQLLSDEIGVFADRSRQRLNRKINGANLATIIVVAVLGGAISFGLVTWAQALSGFWAILVWIVFASWTLFVLLLVLFGGLSQLYKTANVES